LPEEEPAAGRLVCRELTSCLRDKRAQHSALSRDRLFKPLRAEPYACQKGGLMRRFVAASRKPGALIWSGNHTFSLDSASPPEPI
jgi:hypothetical protein